MYTSYTLQVIYLTTTVCTYVYIGKMMVRRQKRFSVAASVRRPEQRLLGRMKCKVPFLISLTFVLLLVVPQYIPNHNNHLVTNLLKRTVSLLVPIIDPIIYLFFQESVRTSAIHILTCATSRTHAQTQTMRHHVSGSRGVSVVKVRSGTVQSDDVIIGDGNSWDTKC